MKKFLDDLVFYSNFKPEKFERVDLNLVIKDILLEYQVALNKTEMGFSFDKESSRYPSKMNQNLSHMRGFNTSSMETASPYMMMMGITSATGTAKRLTSSTVDGESLMKKRKMKFLKNPRLNLSLGNN